MRGCNMEFRILDTDYKDIHVLDSFTSLIWTDRYSACGDFEIELAPTLANLVYLQQDRYIWLNDTEHTMIIEDLRITSDAETGSSLIVSGRSLESLLERRIIWVQTLLSGNLQVAIKKLLDDSIINPSDTERKIPNFIFEPSTDPVIASLTINTQFTGTNLYEAIKGICDANEIGFKIRLSSENQFVFSLYSGVDRSYDQFANPYVIFSPEFDNLINSNYFASNREYKTVTLVAGEGEGLERITEPVYNDSESEIGLNRRELFTDARDISSNNGEVEPEDYAEQLIQRGKSKLAENLMIRVFEGNVDTLHKFVYGVDFFMGDIVQIENEYGLEASARVTELVRSQTVNGIEIFPTFTTIA